jgi:hypothetical protein
MRATVWKNSGFHQYSLNGLNVRFMIRSRSLKTLRIYCLELSWGSIIYIDNDLFKMIRVFQELESLFRCL